MIQAWIAPIAQFCVSCSPTAGCPTWSWRSASGAIRGYHADIDPAAVGRGLEITVHVELTLKDRATVEAFERGIAAFDEVVECRRMFGVPDYIVRVAVADQDAYESFYMNRLAELPGLARVNSQFTMKMVKRGGVLPL
jgi:Lrp/AsnC family transcriptional regulator, leucine-responsive regulatory protein